MFRVGNWNYWSWIMFVAAKPVQYVASQVLFVCVYYFWYFFYIFGIIARRCVRLAMPVNTAVITGGVCILLVFRRASQVILGIRVQAKHF